MTADVLAGDCLAVLPTLGADSFDACVTDPPYHLASIVKRWRNSNPLDQQKNGADRKTAGQGASPHARASAGFMGKQWDGGDIAFQPDTWAAVLRVLKPGAHMLAFGGTKGFHRMACAIEDAGFEIRDTIMWLYGSGFPKSHNQHGEWEGWGTALKPAYEPILLVRKPLIGTVAANLEAHRTGAVNIDGCRVEFAGAADEEKSKTKNQHAQFGSGPMTNQVFGKFSKDRTDYDPSGRWPANVLHDGDAGMGEAARFFYCAKASRADRNEGLEGEPEKPLLWSAGTKNPGSFQSTGTKRAAQNNHPTVKPTELMRYLCRLVTPPGGTILDPFTGSGSTGKAALLEGFNFIGIEREAEYIAIARKRLGLPAVSEVSTDKDVFA